MNAGVRAPAEASEKYFWPVACEHMVRAPVIVGLGVTRNHSQAFSSMHRFVEAAAEGHMHVAVACDRTRLSLSAGYAYRKLGGVILGEDGDVAAEQHRVRKRESGGVDVSEMEHGARVHLVFDRVSRLHGGARHVSHTVDGLGHGGCEGRFREVIHGQKYHVHVWLCERPADLVRRPRVDLARIGGRGEDAAPLVAVAGPAAAVGAASSELASRKSRCWTSGPSTADRRRGRPIGQHWLHEER